MKLTKSGVKMKVSIIIPVYNAEKYIKKCLDSILKQTYKNIEIIVINDGSTDKSYDVLKKYEDKIILINQKNHGVSYSRNVGIEKATGDYIMFVDGDDWIDIDMIENMINEIKEENVDIVHSGYVREYPDHKEKFSLVNTKIKIEKDKKNIYDRFILNYDLSSPCCQLIRKKCIKKKFDKNIKIGEDYLFNLDLYSNIDSCVFLPENYYHYLYNYNSATTVVDYDKIKKRCEDSIEVYSQLLKYIKIWNYNSKDIYQLVYYRIIKELNMKLISIFKINDKKKEIKKRMVYDFIKNEQIREYSRLLKISTIFKKINLYTIFIICIKCNFKKLYLFLGNKIYNKVYQMSER